MHVSRALARIPGTLAVFVHDASGAHQRDSFCELADASEKDAKTVQLIKTASRSRLR